jgi:hypothetical protein
VCECSPAITMTSCPVYKTCSNGACSP